LFAVLWEQSMFVSCLICDFSWSIHHGGWCCNLMNCPLLVRYHWNHQVIRNQRNTLDLLLRIHVGTCRCQRKIRIHDDCLSKEPVATGYC
jgi:hypothetical protein